MRFILHLYIQHSTRFSIFNFPFNKFADDLIIPSLRSVFNISATCTDTVPATWKPANISALYKSDDETDKHTHRPTVKTRN